MVSVRVKVSLGLGYVRCIGLGIRARDGAELGGGLFGYEFLQRELSWVGLN